MSTPRIFCRFLRSPNLAVPRSVRPLSTTASLQRGHQNVNEHREKQKKPLNPHITNTTPTVKDDFPKVGAHNPPPDMISNVKPDLAAADAVPGKIEHMTGGTQQSAPAKPELELGEMEGIKFKVSPLKREGEDVSTKRARLLCSLIPRH